METVRETSFADAIGAPLSGGPATGPFRETRLGWLVLAITWTVTAIYLGLRLRQVWVPSDGGAFAEMAVRTLHGQMPHRDFVEIYTGGMTYLNALAFRLFGVNLFSLRIPLFLLFLGWVPAVYLIARRFAQPFASGALTILAVVWSVPNYPEAMPSWYNLFLATWGALALVKYTETGRRRWLFTAGLCGGLSFLVKSPGLYFVAAGLLFIVFHERSQAPFTAEGSGKIGFIYRLFVTLGLLLFVMVVGRLVYSRPTFAEAFQFLLPSAVLAGFVLWETWAGPARGKGAGFGRLLAMGSPFLGGVLFPMLLFAGWYVHEGALGALVNGVFVKPFGRTLWTAWEPFSPLAEFAGLLPVLLVILFARDRRGRAQRWARIVVPLMFAGLLVWAKLSVAGYIFVGYSVQLAVPLLCLAVPFALRERQELVSPKRDQAFLLIAVAGLCALIEFPLASTIYFCYIAPLVILAALALLESRPGPDRVLLGSLVGFYLAFALWAGVPGYFSATRSAPSRPASLRALDLPRAGGIRGSAEDAATYEKLIPLVQAHANGRYIYCTPNCPEVYFLSGLDSPTRNLFGSSFFLDPVDQAESTLNTLYVNRVRVIVFAPFRPGISTPIPKAILDLFDARFPHSEMVGGFDVRWR